MTWRYAKLVHMEISGRMTMTHDGYSNTETRWYWVLQEDVDRNPSITHSEVKGKWVWKVEDENGCIVDTNSLVVVQRAAQLGWEMTHGLPIGNDHNGNQRRVSMMRRKA